MVWENIWRNIVHAAVKVIMKQILEFILIDLQNSISSTSKKILYENSLLPCHDSRLFSILTSRIRKSGDKKNWEANDLPAIIMK